jgi:hypothetical protein
MWGGEVFSGITSRPHKITRQKLSEILEPNADPKYYLTPAACSGILRRVDAKGKEIPKLLRDALEAQAGISNNPTDDGKPWAFSPGVCARLGRKGSEDLSPTLLNHMGDNQMSVCIPIDERNALRKGTDNCGAGIGNDGDSVYTVTAE